MITHMRVTAACGGCPWSAEGPGSDWDAVQRQADKHLAPGHPVSVTATPATTTDHPAASGAGVAKEGST